MALSLPSHSVCPFKSKEIMLKSLLCRLHREQLFITFILFSSSKCYGRLNSKTGKTQPKGYHTKLMKGQC